MKLQAKDLMIGDWIKFTDGNKKCTVVGVKCDARYLEEEAIITVMDDSGHWFDKELECLQPIPLTPEILEKNGFINKKDKWMQLGNFGNQPLMMWHLKDNSIMLDYKHKMEIHYSVKKCHLTVMCEYVHQFQHALKLCEIEKEIEL